MRSDSPEWFVVRTKPHKERLAHSELARRSVETFLPLLKAPVPVYGRRAWACTPLFPCYLFACFERGATFKVKNTRGVRDVVSSDNEPCVVPEKVVEDLKRRCIDGVVELPAERFEPNERVKVATGVFEGWDAIFERYLRADERVAILLQTVEATAIRVIMPSYTLSKC
jgi:transcriptional antiterminator RfaH